MNIREIADADLVAAQQAIEAAAALEGIEPYRVVALFDRDGKFAGTERIDSKLDVGSMNFRRAYWNPNGVPLPLKPKDRK